MDAAETMVLTKLKSHREQANRDRFILPDEKDESFFTQITQFGIISEILYLFSGEYKNFHHILQIFENIFSNFQIFSQIFQK